MAGDVFKCLLKGGVSSVKVMLHPINHGIDDNVFIFNTDIIIFDALNQFSVGQFVELHKCDNLEIETHHCCSLSSRFNAANV